MRRLSFILLTLAACDQPDAARLARSEAALTEVLIDVGPPGLRDLNNSMVLRDGRLVVISGSTEVYEPLNNRWTSSAGPENHGVSTGTLLDDRGPGVEPLLQHEYAGHRRRRHDGVDANGLRDGATSEWAALAQRRHCLARLERALARKLLSRPSGST